MFSLLINCTPCTELTIATHLWRQFAIKTEYRLWVAIFILFFFLFKYRVCARKNCSLPIKKMYGTSIGYVKCLTGAGPLLGPTPILWTSPPNSSVKYREEATHAQHWPVHVQPNTLTQHWAVRGLVLKIGVGARPAPIRHLWRTLSMCYKCLRWKNPFNRCK